MNIGTATEKSGFPHAIWLASRSPRRLQLLETLGLEVKLFFAQDIAQAEALEIPWPNENPLNYVQRVTALKLRTALQAMQMQNLDGLVLAADTTVALGSKILGKPQSRADAFAMLKSLSNTSHHVHTAVAGAWLANNGQVHAEKHTHQTSRVEFASLPQFFIESYIDSGEPFDKAGAYGIQGTVGQYVRHISGSHSGIMGLPLFETSKLMRQIHEAAQAAAHID